MMDPRLCPAPADPVVMWLIGYVCGIPGWYLAQWLAKRAVK